MSEIIRDTYTRAVLEQNPLPREVGMSEFEDILRSITNLFGKDLEDILSKFSLLNSDSRNLGEYMIEYVIKGCLPKNALYGDYLVNVSYNREYFPGSYVEVTYYLYVLSQKDVLRRIDSVWIWENRNLVEEFMKPDNMFYKNLIDLKTKFPIKITYIE